MISKDTPRILCVDDELEVLETLEELLRDLRPTFELCCVQEPGDALDALSRQGPFHVVVSDLRMPGTDGITLLQRAGEIAADAARVLLTGHADLSVALAAVNEGRSFSLFVFSRSRIKRRLWSRPSTRA